MSGMNKTELERRLAAAAQASAPDLTDVLWETPVEAAKGDEWFLERPAHGNGSRSRTVYIISALAALLALVIMTRSVQMTQTYAMIYLDVNPSIHLEIDRRDRVKSALANNADGEKVLEGMDLSNTDLDVAINAIFGSMVRGGYLTQERNVVLLSVDSRDEKKAKTLRAEISKEIDECLAALLSNATVLDQSVQTDESLESLAKRYGITPGKAALIQRLVDANPGLVFEELVGLTMDDLVRQLLSEGIDLEAYADITGVIPAADATLPAADNTADGTATAAPFPTAVASPAPSVMPSPGSGAPITFPPQPSPADYDDDDDYDDNDDYDDGYDDDYDDGYDDDYDDDYDYDDEPAWSAPSTPAPQATAPPVNYDDDYDDYDDDDDDD